MRQLVHVTGQPQPQPVAGLKGHRVNLAVKHAPGQIRTEQHPAAIDEGAWPGQGPMGANEAVAGNAVAIEKNDVLGACLMGDLSPQVAGLRGGEAGVGVPGVPGRRGAARKARLQRRDFLGPGPVIGHHQHIDGCQLGHQGPKQRKQRFAAVVGEDDEADAHQRDDP